VKIVLKKFKVHSLTGRIKIDRTGVDRTGVGPRQVIDIADIMASKCLLNGLNRPIFLQNCPIKKTNEKWRVQKDIEKEKA